MPPDEGGVRREAGLAWSVVLHRFRAHLHQRPPEAGVTREPITRSTIVRSDQAHTFDVFVREIGTWWPVRPYSLGQAAVVDVTVTPGPGGRVFETHADGTTVTWGHLLAWDPPARFAMTWEVFAGGTEVEVTFRSLGPTLTRVELEHRGWERLPEEQLRTVTAAAGGYATGWSTILTAFAEALGGTVPPQS